MTKLLFISTVYPYPEDNGKKVVISGILNFFIKALGIENIQLVVLGQQEIECINELSVMGLPKPGTKNQLLNLFYYTLLTRKKSIQESILYSKANKKELDRIVTEMNPDIIIYDTLRVSQYYEEDKSFEKKHVLYLEDLFSVRYDKMLQILQKYPHFDLNSLGNFANRVPSVFKSLLKLSFIQKFALKYERNLIASREINAVKWFDKSLLINHQETAYLARVSQQDSIFTVKPLLKQREQLAVRNFCGDPVFVFVGDLKVPHNQVSIKTFIVSQMENIIFEIPEVMIRIIGRHADQELIDLAKKYPEHLSIEGYVDDLGSILAGACGMVIPLLFGSGVKLKTIEALASGMPIISTDFGVEGINDINHTHCIIENDFNEYAKVMKQLCDIKVNALLSKNAMDFYRNNYQKETIDQEYEKLFLR
ncbi:Glycosyl transferase, group 1 [Dehalobacter sp. DCA]|jgi:hypothetical protein|nr:Glycosyl transferase, group 1 [Dehalobacter sp. DCA]